MNRFNYNQFKTKAFDEFNVTVLKYNHLVSGIIFKNMYSCFISTFRMTVLSVFVFYFDFSNDSTFKENIKQL